MACLMHDFSLYHIIAYSIILCYMMLYYIQVNRCAMRAGRRQGALKAPVDLLCPEGRNATF